MADARLTHPTRPTLPFYQRQSDEENRTLVADAFQPIGSEPKVYTESRQRGESIRGLVTGNRRAANDPDTNDKRQALANYVDRLESHVDEYQGDGYTYEDDILDVSKNAILREVTWEIQPGQVDSLIYTADVVVGRGVLTERDISRERPTVNTSMTPMLRVDGIDLPGMRRYEVAKNLKVEEKPIFDRDSAENNDIVVESGAQRIITFEGTFTGDASQRAATDDALDDLLATRDAVTLETKFPGYEIEGFVKQFDSDQRSEFGSQRSDYTFQFVEGTGV